MSRLSLDMTGGTKQTIAQRAVTVLGHAYVWLARKVFPQETDRAEAESAPDANMLAHWTVQIAFNEERGNYRAIVLSRQEGKSFLVEKTSLEWVLYNIKTAILARQRLLEKKEPNEESRIIVPARFSANGSVGR